MEPNMKRRAILGIALIGLVGGTVLAGSTFRTAIPMGTAPSWSAATNDPNVVQGIWFSNTNVAHMLVHDSSDNGDHDTYPVVSVNDYQGATDDARLTAAIAAAPINSTLRVTKSLSLTANVTINKALALAVEANTTITTNSTSINVTTGPTSFIGRGPNAQIIQGAANTDVVVVTGGPFNVEDLAFVGVAGTSLVNHNSAILATSMNDIKVLRSTFTNFQFHSVLTQGCNRVLLDENTFVGNIAWLCRGGSQLAYSNNLARDPQTPNTTFIIPLQFDSTAGGFGVATDVTVTGNTFLNWPASQCIELHTGDQFTITGNLMDNCYIGISVNTFQAGDIAQDGAISGNTIIASTTSGLATSIANIGISMTGIAAAPVQRIAVTGNYVLNGNAYTANAIWGCINISGNLNDILVSGNTLDTCTANGIAFNGANTRISVLGNHIHNIITGGGANNGMGVWSTTGQSGFISNNDIDSTNIGIRLDVSSNMTVGQNNMTNIATARILNPTNGTMQSFSDGVAVNSIGTAQTVGQSYTNNTAAANNAQQYGPCIEDIGQGWDSTNSLSKAVKCCWQMVPVQGAGNPTGNYTLWCSINGAAYAEAMRVTNVGVVQVPAGQRFDTNASGALGFGTANATSISFGNSAVTTLNVAATTMNIGTSTNTTINLSKAGSATVVNSSLQANQGFAPAYRSAASTVTVAVTDRFVGVSGSGARTVNLPAASTCVAAGQEIIIQDIGNSAGAITINPNGTDNINGVNSAVSIAAAFGRKWFICDKSANWYVDVNVI
jgi:hypothetical protein